MHRHSCSADRSYACIPNIRSNSSQLYSTHVSSNMACALPFKPFPTSVSEVHCSSIAGHGCALCAVNDPKLLKRRVPGDCHNIGLSYTRHSEQAKHANINTRSDLDRSEHNSFRAKYILTGFLIF